MWTRSSVRSIERSVNAGKLLITTTKDGRLLAERWKQRISKPFSPPLRWDVIADVLSIPNRWFLCKDLIYLFTCAIVYLIMCSWPKISASIIKLNLSFFPRRIYWASRTCSMLNHVTCRLDKSRRRSKLCLHNLLHLQASRILWFW